MKESIKVSIIIPVHNAEKTLERCINSVLSQSYKNIECILVENSSQDNSASLCSMYAKKYKNIITESINKKGVSNARNHGLMLVTGDIVGFCDSDDFLEINAVENVVSEFFKSKDLVAIFGGFNATKIDQKGNIVKIYKGLKEQTISVSKAMQLIIINDCIMGSVWNKYYKTNLLKNINFDCSLSFCEDMHFNARVLDAIEGKERIKVISTPLYCYVENSESVTHNTNILFDDKDELKYIVSLKKIHEDCKLDKRIDSLLRMKIACFSIDFLLKTEINKKKKEKLLYELNNNFKYLVINFFENNWKWNIKRIYKGIYYLCKYKKYIKHNFID